MQTINISYPHTYSRSELPETVAAIGFFDGIHQGHQAVIKKAVEKARQKKQTSAVISFYPHPSVVLKQPSEPVEYITPNEEKAALLESLGVDRFYIITFNKELSLLPPKAFIEHFIIGLHVRELIAGFDFSFGHKGAGNMKNIHEFHDDAFTVTEVDKVVLNDEKISSTNIRKQFAKGDLEEANAYLGRTYKAYGTVVEGEKRGRQLGFPTANLAIDNEKLLPRQGVYAVTVDYNGKTYNGMANLGVKPTFHQDTIEPITEVFIFDFNQDIYGDQLTVYWHTFIRPEKKFNGVDEIKAQLHQDEKRYQGLF